MLIYMGKQFLKIKIQHLLEFFLYLKKYCIQNVNLFENQVHMHNKT